MSTDVIILNRMYVGDYLGENIGHEVINLMKPDDNNNNDNNNNYYIYINARGDLNDEFIKNEWKAKTILLTRWCSREYKEEGMKNTKKQSFLEVLAMIGSTDSKDKLYIQPWTLEDTIKKEQELIKKTIYEDFKNFNDKFHSNIILKGDAEISDILKIQKAYNRILNKLKEIYKQQNIPIAIYNINNISQSAKKQNKVYAQKEQDKLIEDDKKKDNTGKYKKNHKNEKIVCTKKEVEGYKQYLNEREEYYNKPLQKLKHELQVISLKDVKYGGKALQEIFAKNIRNDRALYVTFTAKNIKMVKPGYHIYLIGNNINKKEKSNQIKFINVNIDENDNVVTEKLNFSRQSLRQYIQNDKHKDVYNNILTQLNNLNDFWEEQPPLTFDDRKNLEDKDPHHIDVTPQKANFIDIIRKNYDELIYSNLFYHIFKSKPKLFYEFATSEKGLNISQDKLSTNCKETLFLREDGNIDLLIDDKDKKTLIVIENKIKSGINGIRYNELDKECGNQLSKYIHYTYGYKVKKGTDKSGYEYEQFSEQENEIKPYKDYKHREFFIFAPRYKNFDIETINGNLKKENTKDEYQLITYDKIYDFFNNQDIKKNYSSIPYYEEFLYAIKNHKYESDNIQERQMFERFAERI